MDRISLREVKKNSPLITLTLQKLGELRGCIEAPRPLIHDVIHNAFASAFRDFRFQPVVEDELAQLKIEISILSPMELMPVKTEKELLEAMEPGRDGIYLQSDQHSATFLPQVWEQLPEPEEFLAHLKQKAGFSKKPLEDGVQFFKYTCFKLKE